MATVGFSEAARLAAVSRQHIYKLAETGKISTTQELLPGKLGDSPKDFRQTIDVSELQRVFGKLTSGDIDTGGVYEMLEAELGTARQLLRDREEQLKAAKEREEWLKKQVEENQNTFKLIGHSKIPGHTEVVPLERYQLVVKSARGKIADLLDQLEAQKNRGFWARLFNK